MGFLNNSGDIILDAVLTDTGRKRLAAGDGSFKVVKFAIGDDEIDYSLYNKDDSRGTAYYDLDVLSTPVFEAFTNNTSTMINKLLTLPNPNLLYLPIIKINDKSSTLGFPLNTSVVNNGLLLSTDQTTTSAITANNTTIAGLVVHNYSTFLPNAFLVLDQGLDSSADGNSSSRTIDASLKETQYIVEMDNRLMQLRSTTTYATIVNPKYIDDDFIASYLLTDQQFVSQITVGSGTSATQTVLAGDVGTRLKFTLAPTSDIQSSNYLFETIGSSNNTIGASGNVYKIVTNIRITGVTTGYSITVPVAIIKKQ